ncbi:MAG: amino acid ABC transporter permease [Acidimicrobiales bacterium]
MTAPVIADALGPRARRKVRIASLVAGVIIAAWLVLAVKRAADNDQLSPERWGSILRWPVLKFLLIGLWTTVRLAAVAMVLAILIGGIMALGRLAHNRLLKLAAGAYTDFFRAMPVLLLIYFSALGLPRYGFDFSAFWFVVFALAAYNGAVLSEIFRAGILSLDRGQSEAAYSLGLGYWQAMLLVIVPQAARRMIPAIVSQLITLLKDTSLAFVIALEELSRRSRIVGEFTGNILQAYTIAAILYIIVNFALSRLARRLEVRQRRRLGAGAIEVTGVDELAVVGAQAEAVVQEEE